MPETYDRSVPAVDAVELYNELMVDWNLKEKIPILLYQEITIAVRDFQRVRHGSVIRTILRTQLAEAFEPVEFKTYNFLSSLL